jgi:hypothetical protein
MNRNRSGMGTIFIHHAPDDLFAAEAIAGMLVDCGTVVLRAHDPQEDAAAFAERLGVDWHVVLWNGAATPALRKLTAALLRAQAPHLVLTFDATTLPAKLPRESQFPLFDRGVEWPSYRAALRRRLCYAVSSYAPRPAHPVLHSLNAIERRLAPALSRMPELALVALGGITLWSLLRG